MRCVVVTAVLALGLPSTAVATPDAGVPPVSPQAAAAGLIDVRTVVPDAIVDLRYAGADNFLGMAVYPPDARCLVHQSMGSGLATAASARRATGLTLVIWDCYRPHEVQVQMFEVVPDPTWVARPGEYARSHEAGRSVDVTMASDGAPVDMGTDFDNFTPLAQSYATEGLNSQQQANRAVLRNAMATGGIVPYTGEWWHFDGPGAGRPRPFLDAPVN